ncbi:MAG: proton-conducting membrane transporter [Lachnospiraceae bacterium]|nr:proton-conducting membrane transporter [Lachnospiraceae bacterium]
MNSNYMILLPVLLPVIAGLLIPVIKPLNNRNARNYYVIGIIALTGIFTVFVASLGDIHLSLWKMTDSLEIYFKVDGMGRLFAVLTAAMWLMSAIFSKEYMKHEHDESRYFAFFVSTLGVLVGLCFSGNLITMYVFYEFMTLLTLPLVLHELTKGSIAAGVKYLFYSMTGAFLGLGGFFFLSQYADTLTFTEGGVLNMTKVAGHEGLLLAVVFFMILGFGSKAGMLPLHGWLPTAHPVAPAPASAVLSGNITKMGVLAIIRVVYYIVGADFIRGTWVQYAWMGVALATVFMGSMLAYKEQILKKRLAYSTVSQVSYVLFGLSLLNVTGMTGALLHVVFHSVVKNALFLTAGAIIYKTGKTKVSELTGIGKEMPVMMWCFTLVSVTLVGIPPTSAFISKWYLGLGSLETGISVFSWLGPVVLLVSALLTAGYLITISIKGFFPGADYDYSSLTKQEPKAVMVVPVVILTVVAVVCGMFPNSLISFMSSLAGTIL